MAIFHEVNYYDILCFRFVSFLLAWLLPTTWLFLNRVILIHVYSHLNSHIYYPSLLPCPIVAATEDNLKNFLDSPGPLCCVSAHHAAITSYDQWSTLTSPGWHIWSCTKGKIALKLLFIDLTFIFTVEGNFCSGAESCSVRGQYVYTSRGTLSSVPCNMLQKA